MMPSNSLSGDARRRNDWIILTAMGLGCLFPFVGKCVHIDDPLFIWAAQHIQQYPADFFGFHVHWYVTWQPMAHVTQNPPGACYYLAAAGSLLGWGEDMLHLAMTLPAVGVLWGTYRLAERFGARPLHAALLTLAAPAFLLCSSTLMCDTLMLCLWVWAIVFWDIGLRSGSTGRLYVASLLVALAVLTKYFAICLLPLLIVYSMAVDLRGWRRWLTPLGLTAVAIFGYQAWTQSLYGYGHMRGAAAYASAMGSLSSPGKTAFRLCSGLAFVGGCVGVSALVLPLVLGGRSRLAVVVVTASVVFFALFLPTISATDLGDVADSPFAAHGKLWLNWTALAQFALWSAAGIAVIFLAAADLVERRDAGALLLFVWVLGTYLFAAYINWALNGRSVLPLVPAVAILIVRRLDRRLSGGGREPAWVWPAFLAPGLALALVVTWADAELAEAQWLAVSRLTPRQVNPQGRQVWFTGHWGWQYYLTKQGARPWDYLNPGGQVGDLIVLPDNNTKFPVELPRNTRDLFDVQVPVCAWLTTMHQSVGAGYYSDYWGPLPFAFGPVPVERFYVKQLISPPVERKGAP